MNKVYNKLVQVPAAGEFPADIDPVRISVGEYGPGTMKEPESRRVLWLVRWLGSDGGVRLWRRVRSNLRAIPDVSLKNINNQQIYCETLKIL